MDSQPRGLSDIDATRAMRTDDELYSLIEAVHGSPADAQETNWLEWKSGLELTSAAGKFAMTKAILGFSNRSVEQAQLACEGVAYMLVGVQPLTAAGIEVIDHADLGQGIGSYTNGTRWRPFYIPFAGVTVLVIVVEPPRPGDPIHTLRKAYERFYKGTIFHRGTAHTEPAGPDEVDMLGKRLLQGMQEPALDLALACTADPLARLHVDDKQLDDWLRRREVYVRANSGKPADNPAPRARSAGSVGIAGLSALDLGGSIGVAGLGGIFANRENAAEFEKRVKKYLATMRHCLLDNIIREIVLDEDANTVRFQVSNETDASVSGVQLTVRVPKAGLRVYASPPRADEFPPLPTWPDSLDQMRRNIFTAELRPQALDFHLNSDSVVEKEDVFEVTWSVGDLRPRERSGDFTITVVAGPKAPEMIDVEMVASAMDRRGIRTAIQQLTVAPDAWVLDDFYDAEPSE